MTFHQWYEQQYRERWKDLSASLAAEVPLTELSNGLAKTYHLDEASVYAASALGALPGERILDACAAPGGKTLVIAVSMQGTGSLTANDRSSARRARLHRVLNEHLDEHTRNSISITSHDASRWGLYEQNEYDRILLDVPCSSERHVMQSPKELARWNPSRSRRLAVQQFAMAAAALEAVKPGGRILYSTCSISELENDGVMEKLLVRRAGRCSVTPPEGIPWGEPTRHGWIILPDRCGGRGPLYIAVISKAKQEQSL